MCTWECIYYVLFLLLQVFQYTDCEVIYITPSLNTPCHQRSCLSLTQYINNPNPGLNTTIVLLSGNHSLVIPLSVMNKERFLMIGSSNTAPRVTCTSTGNLSLTSIDLVMIRGISFLGCGHNTATSIVNFTMQDTTFENSTTIHNGAIWSISSSTTVQFENCTFANNIIQRGGTLSVNIASILVIFMCTFTNNEVRQDFREGGALLITKTNATISQSIFLSNQVRKGDGGAVYISGGNLTINESMFIRNQANGSSGEGGALYIKNANSIVTKSTFMINEAGEGGALYINGGSISISNSNYTHNQAEDGGALCAWRANSTVIRSSFTSNQGRGYSDAGGAIYVNGGHSIIGESTFISNQVKGSRGQGGAIHIWNAITSEINNSTFIQNQANGSRGRGGAVSIWNTDLLITLSIFIKNCVRGQGGAIYLRSLTQSAVVINTSTFTENYIHDRGDDGGAIYIANVNSTIDNTIFINNQASGSSGAGGAVYCRVQYSSVSVFLNFCDFINNKAGPRKKAGAVQMYGGSFRHEGRLSIGHCHFSDNSGEAIYTYNVSKLFINFSTFVNHSNGRASLFTESPIRRNSYGEVLVNQSSFVGNTGAIESINIRHIEIHSSTLNRNIVHSQKGGAITATGKYVEILLSHSTFSRNTAISCGAVSISTLYARIVLVSNNFSNSIATGQYMHSGGGVACFRNASITVKDSRFNDNLANFNGGVFSINESFVTIEKSIFSSNSASNSGGIGFIVNSSLVVRESMFINNSALHVGGVFAIKNGLAAINKNLFFNNRADGEGGVLYFYSNLGDLIFLKIEGNKFLGNKATTVVRILHTENYTIESDDILQAGCVCYCSTAHDISRTFAVTRTSSNCTVCSLLNERFNEIATCSADNTSTILSKPREPAVAASISSAIAVTLIAALAVIAAIMIYKRFRTNTSPGRCNAG